MKNREIRLIIDPSPSQTPRISIRFIPDGFDANGTIYHALVLITTLGILVDGDVRPHCYEDNEVLFKA